MSKQDKNSIEKLFKKGAQNHNFEFNESDWRKLEAKLDNELPVTFSPWLYLKRYRIIPLALIIGLGSFLIYKRISNPKIQVDEREIVSNPIPNNSALRTATDFQSTENNNNLTSSNSLEENLNQIKSKNQKESKKTELAKNSAFDYQNSSAVNDISINNTNENNKFQNQESEIYTSYDIKNRSGEAIPSYSLVPILTKNLSPIFTIVPDNIKQPNGIENIQDVETIVNEKPKSHKFLSLGIGLSPDFSTVNSSDFISPGIRWKFYLEYNLSKRFAISTGAIYVNNKYEAYAQDYHAPSRYWKDGIVASEAYGECIMIDIPLNVRYNPLIKGNHQLFISGGVSTYFVLKEDYFFSYEVDDPDLPDYWGTDKMSSYPFGIINASIGYEYLLNRKSSLQVEPFINIPTTGIGWGEVKLYTIGLFFAYKFRPGKIKY